MKVTNVVFHNINTDVDSSVKATCSITLDDVLRIHHIHIIEGTKGLFIGFPNTGEMKLYKNGKRYVDIVHPCNEKLRSEINEAVLEQYRLRVG